MQNIRALALILLTVTAISDTTHAMSASEPKPAKQSICDTDPFFNKKFLVNYDAVKKELLANHGFVQVQFLSEDGIKLEGLLRTKANAKCTVISCSGFFPGRMEGMATLHRLLPDDCNILFFNARGHGNSEGFFKATILKYGNVEYKDVIGAIDYAHKQSPAPIFIHGICIGAFHATHALANLQQRNLLEQYNVKGFIFDSGFGSLAKISNALKYDLDHKIIPKMFKAYVYTKDTKEQIRERYLFMATRLF